MANPDEIFRKYRCKTPEWEANFEKPCFSLEMEIFKEIASGGESPTAAETSEISNLDGNNVATTTHLSCKEPFGGFFPCILVFEPEMNPESCAGEMYYWKRILKQNENSSFGGRREDPRQGKGAVKLATDDLSVQNSSLLVITDAQLNSTKRLGNTGLTKLRN